MGWKRTKPKEQKGKNWIAAALWGCVTIWIVQTWWPGLIPWPTFDLWTPRGSLGEWLRAAWPILAFGCGLNFVIQIINWVNGDSPISRAFNWFIRKSDPSAARIFGAGTLISLWAGVAEEIAFRWLIFYAAIGTVTLGNFIFFGWLGFGIPEWFHLNVWGPIADWTTGGYLTQYIFFPYGNPDGPVSWAVGAGMLYSNAMFRDGHKYLGLLGVVNSWFLGMYFFWMSFRYGLISAIVVHFAYDFLIFATVAFMTALRQRRIA